MPESLRLEFESETGLSYDEVIDRVYRQPMANKFLASLVGFVSKHRKQCRAVLEEEFDTFIERNILPYGRNQLPVGIVGGVGHEFSEELHQAFSRHGLSLEKVLAKPIGGLVDYHVRKQGVCLD